MKKLNSSVTALLLSFCCSFWVFTATYAQSGRSEAQISGTVVDASGQKITGATVMLVSNNKIATITDSSGSFTLKLPATISGAVQIVVTYIGYEKKQVTPQT